MTFVAARCPQCGGDLQLDNEKDTGFCMHCGSKILIKDAINAVRIDNSHMIDTWMQMGDLASEAENLSEAYEYYTKVVEVQPNNWIAIYKKAKAAGWQSTLANLRLKEALVGFGQSYSLAPDREKDDLADQIETEVEKLSCAVIALQSKRFVDWPDDDEVTATMQVLIEVIANLGEYWKENNLEIPDITKLFTKIIQSNVVSAYNSKILIDYYGDDRHPSEYDWREYLNRIHNCWSLLVYINATDENDYEGNIDRYKMMISLHNDAINSCSWDYNITDFGKVWHKQYFLSSNAIQTRRNFISEYKNEIKKLEIAKENKEKEEAKARFVEYWNEHPDEKNELSLQKETLAEKIIQIENNMNIASQSLNSQLETARTNINQLEKEKRSIGLLKMKEKSSMNLQIKEKTDQLKQIEEKITEIQKPFIEEINRYQEEIKKIDQELTRPR